jgi:hypothetical protein
MKKNNGFPLKHIVIEETKEILIECKSSTTRFGVPFLVKKYYPGYKSKIVKNLY